VAVAELEIPPGQCPGGTEENQEEILGYVFGVPTEIQSNQRPNLKQQCQKLWADMFGDSEQIATLYMS
jgi:hypothetical protein